MIYTCVEKGLLPFSHAFIGGVCVFYGYFPAQQQNNTNPLLVQKLSNRGMRACNKSSSVGFWGQKQVGFLCFSVMFWKRDLRPGAKGIYLAGRGEFGNRTIIGESFIRGQSDF
jgi:hypothetical protein